MKWIGQHIYDNISRFRNKLYLEGDTYLSGISTSTETDMLVVDSNNKISKRAIDAITVDVSDFMANGEDNCVLTATGALKLIVVALDPSVDVLTCDELKCTLLKGKTFVLGVPFCISCN